MAFFFTKFIPDNKKTVFENLLNLFLQLLQYTGGDAYEALQWLTEVDKEYRITDDDYGIGDFIDDLKAQGYITEDPINGVIAPTSKPGRELRKRALEHIFGKLRKGGTGQHKTVHTGGGGDEYTTDYRPFEFGDSFEYLNMSNSLRNAQINNGIDDFRLTERDLEMQEREWRTTTSTVLMLDISHSMILYGEDRITPAKQVAMALAELIKTRYPKDTLDIIVFGNDAWTVQLKDLPYLQVGPYHTNTVAGLELAMDLLHRKKNANKNIVMITDGKPTCLKINGRYYKNSWGMDRKIINKCLNLAAQCRRINIPITTFMIAQDPWLQQFVREFTETNKGRAYYAGLDNLGSFVLEDFERNRTRTVR